MQGALRASLLFEVRRPGHDVTGTEIPGVEHWLPSIRRTARLFVLGFELADHSLGLVVEGGEDLVGVLFRVVKSQAADCVINDFMTVPRSRPG
jgi:hypothetical protein